MIQHYIFDFGNVLCEFDPEKLTEPFVSNEEEKNAISEVVFDRIYWDELDKGTITDEEVKAKICSRIGDKLGYKACQVYDNWVRTITPIDEMIHLVYELHKNGKKIYLLSNISIGFSKTYMEIDWIAKLFSCFDGLVFSGPVGIVKPSKEIFEYTINKFNIDPKKCLFVDDRTQNIEGAEAVGISGYLFDGNVQKLRKFLGLE